MESKNESNRILSRTLITFIVLAIIYAGYYGYFLLDNWKFYRDGLQKDEVILEGTKRLEQKGIAKQGDADELAFLINEANKITKKNMLKDGIKGIFGFLIILALGIFFHKRKAKKTFTIINISAVIIVFMLLYFSRDIIHNLVY